MTEKGIIERLVLPEGIKVFPTGSKYIDRYVQTHSTEKIKTAASKAGSDYDYVIDKSHRSLVDAHLNNISEVIGNRIDRPSSVKFDISVFSMYLDSVKGDRNPHKITINFIYKDSLEYDAWETATEQICEIACKQSAILADKNIRVAIFQSLVVAAGGTPLNDGYEGKYVPSSINAVECDTDVVYNESGLLKITSLNSGIGYTMDGNSFLFGGGGASSRSVN
jgi:hypothetical protein